METTNGTTAGPGFRAALHRLGELPRKLDHEIEARPYAALAAVAGLSFLGGMLLGSRTARALIVAAAPVIANRLLDGPLGEDLSRYVRSAFAARPATAH